MRVEKDVPMSEEKDEPMSEEKASSTLQTEL